MRSRTNPIVAEFEAKGAVVHLLDIEKSSVPELAEKFEGIDTVISCLLTSSFLDQKVVIDACKVAGVKRFLPSEWATAVRKGGFFMKDKVGCALRLIHPRSLRSSAEARGPRVHQISGLAVHAR